MDRPDEIEHKIKSFIEDRFLVLFDNEKISPITNLFEASVINSYGMVELVVFLEFDLEHSSAR